MTTVAIIQARMSSSRFPGKHLAPLAGKPMIDHVVSAVERTGTQFVIATSNDRSDDPLAAYCESRAWDCFRGSLNNPLERTHFAAERTNASVVTRLTGDCPLIDWRLINHLQGKFFDYVWTLRTVHKEDCGMTEYFGQTNSPDGTDVEVFTASALRRAHQSARKSECEHTTTWIRKNLKCESVESDPQYADVHYSVNTLDDLRLCERLLAECGEGAHWEEHVEAYRRIHAQPA